MPVRTISYRIPFDSAHRLLEHEGKCKYLHGHSYVAVITVTGSELDALGMIIDFGVIKERIKGWIDRNWDHNILLNERDPLAQIWKQGTELCKTIIGNKRPYFFVGNPTAENMAEELCSHAKGALVDQPVNVVNVKIQETENGWAEYSPWEAS